MSESSASKPAHADVVHIITGLDVGGAERTLANLLISGLSGDTDNHTHAVISLTGDGRFAGPIRDSGVPVCELGMRRGVPTPGALWKLKGCLNALQPHLLQGWMYHGNLAASLVRPLVASKPRTAWNIRQTLYDLSREKPLTRWTIRRHIGLSSRVDAIIYNSEVSRAQHETLGLEADRARVIANGVDTERFRPDPEARTSAREAFSVADDSIVIGHAGRFHPMKNHEGFLRAAVTLARTHPDLHFVLCGPGVTPDNPVLRCVSDEIPGGRVSLLGERPDMERLLPGFDLFCSSSSWGEGFPNVVAEAMSCGVPCVVTDIGDGGRIVGDVGVVVPPEDDGLLARALERVVAESAEARRAHGDRARERIVAHYSLEGVVKAYQSLYRELLEPV